MFFLGEYCNMILMSALMIVLFVGGWLANDFFLGMFLPSFIFSFKTSVVCFFFVLVRATLPRYRYDQLMDIGWKIFLPLTLGFLIFISGILIMFNSGVYVHEVLPHVFSSSILTTNII
jgi:NADH-quinone oxidoreductase subunit H